MSGPIDDPLGLEEEGNFIQGRPIRDPRTGIDHRVMAPAGRYDFRYMWTRCGLKINIVDAAQRIYNLPHTDCSMCLP